MNEAEQRAKAKAERAAAMLRDTAASSGGSIALTWSYLRDLASVPKSKYVRLIYGDESWSVRRQRLAAMRSAMRPFGDVLCWLDSAGLHLRWRGGKGGLDLRAELPSAWDSTFDVTVAAFDAARPADAAPTCPEPAKPEQPELAASPSGPGLAVIVHGGYTPDFWRAFHRACNT